jgi:hypothetical protein
MAKLWQVKKIFYQKIFSTKPTPSRPNKTMDINKK